MAGQDGRPFAETSREIKIGIDIDGVLANFESGFAPILTRLSGTDFPLDDPNFPPVWGWPMHYLTQEGHSRADARAIESTAWDMVASDVLFWQELRPMPATIRTLQRLSELREQGHDIYFITHRFGDQSKLQTERWLGFFGMANPTVIKSGNKGPLAVGMELDCFIDDKPLNCDQVFMAVAGTKGLVKTRVYICDRPYNQTGLACADRIIRVSGVEEMLDLECGLTAVGSGELSETPTNG